MGLFALALQVLTNNKFIGYLQRRLGRLEIRLGEELLRVEGSHASGAGGGDRLAVDFVHDVAAGEYAWH